MSQDVRQYATTHKGRPRLSGRKTQIRVGDVMVDVTDEDFEIVTEPWNDYRLLDGGRVRAKTTVQKIPRP